MSVSASELHEINNKINCELDNKILFRTLSSLTVNKAHTIKNLSPVKSKFGECLVATLLEDNANEFKVWLPKRVSAHMSEAVIEEINESQNKYLLTYIGQSSPKTPGTRSKCLMKFDYIQK
ncbi:unnamed protein product [Callosobruchus maculatus]|uniref:Uncharacterized protein n=1 Tax=Callosobruchus maculatus TaxID=64391 RepID=A0A653D3A9_CALMS|nr:unnamed protein product [Callosobruchus maculatus]